MDRRGARHKENGSLESDRVAVHACARSATRACRLARAGPGPLFAGPDAALPARGIARAWRGGAALRPGGPGTRRGVRHRRDCAEPARHRLSAPALPGTGSSRQLPGRDGGARPAGGRQRAGARRPGPAREGLRARVRLRTLPRRSGRRSGGHRRRHGRLAEPAPRLRRPPAGRSAGRPGGLRGPQPRGLLAHAADGHRLRQLPRSAVAGAGTARGLLRLARQRNLLCAERAHRSAVPSLFAGRRRGVRNPAGRGRTSRPLRRGCARLR